MALAATYTFDSYYTGDTVDGVTFTFTDSEGDPIDVSSCEACMEFRFGSKTGTLTKQFTESDGITLSGNQLILANFNQDWDPGTYYYDVQLTFTDGSVRTYITGTISIVQDVSQC